MKPIFMYDSLNYLFVKVVIIGGGFCGVLIAKKLEKLNHIETVLIDKKSYFEYQPGLHKVIFKLSYISKLRVDYVSFLKNTRVIIANVEKVTSNHVQTSKRRISFDILVISTGVDYPIFLENKKNVHVLKNGEGALEIARKIENAGHVLIVGGGVIGTEIAGEIVTKMPHKKLTIVHSHKRVLKRIPYDASIYTIRFLRKMGLT
jgi:NADH oxidase (H2O2-forming)